MLAAINFEYNRCCRYEACPYWRQYAKVILINLANVVFPRRGSLGRVAINLSSDGDWSSIFLRNSARLPLIHIKAFCDDDVFWGIDIFAVCFGARWKQFCARAMCDRNVAPLRWGDFTMFLWELLKGWNKIIIRMLCFHNKIFFRYF